MRAVETANQRYFAFDEGRAHHFVGRFGRLSMRYLLMMTIAVTVVGCATQPATKEAAARRHAANIAAAEDAGCKVISKNGQTMFCPTQARMGSHIAVCLTESEWEQEQMGAFNWKVFNAPDPFTVTYRESY